VSRREREFGIRLVLGAQRSQIFSMSLKPTGWLVALGILAGILLAIPLNGRMSSLLGSTVEFRPVAFTGTALLLALCGSGYPRPRPACRASRAHAGNQN